MKELNEFIAKQLISLKAVKLQPSNPFTWANGWLCPVYFDSRKLLSYPRTRSMLKVELSRVVIERFPDVEAIAAVAPNAIAAGILVAEELGLPFVYVNTSPKNHGLENSIEGELKPHQKVVIIDDQISIGFRCARVKDILQKDGSVVLGMVTIFHYNLKEGWERLEEQDLQCFALTGLDDIINYATTHKHINKDNVDSLRRWQKDPANWKR